MSDWASGYVTEIDYSYGYYEELNTLRVPFALLTAGVRPPQIEVACELGFGQGLSVAIHSAASPVTWWGTDFNPAQASLAQALVRDADSGARLFDDSFADFCSRPDLPDFDFIALHGIFTWVSDENRRLIVDFLRRKLKVGGILYISYNTLPGWSTFASMRHLLTEHAAIFGSAAQGIETRLGDALAFAQKLLATEPLYGQVNPMVRDRLQMIMQLNSTYLAHELFCRDWLPMHFPEMKRWLEPAKLSFVTSADYLDLITPMTLSASQHALIQELPDPCFRELVMDFMVNRQFRRDYWVKGPRDAPPLEVAEGLRQQSVVLTRPRTDVVFKVEGAQREISMQPAVYAPILDALADHQPVTVDALVQNLRPSMPFDSLCEALTALFATGAVSPAQAQADVARARPAAARLNAALMNKARADDSIRHLASPVTGGGIVVPRNHQLFLLARARGEPESAWAEVAWRPLEFQGERLQVDGGFAQTPEENLRILRQQAREFSARHLPVLKGLGVATDVPRHE